MKKRTLWTILAVLFVITAIIGPFTDHTKSFGDIIIGVIGCLLLAALFWWLRSRADPEARFHLRNRKVPTGRKNGLPDNYTSIDIETTGLNTQSDRIVELGAVRIRDGKPSGSFSQLVNPGFPLPAKTTEITGITAGDILGQPDTTTALKAFFAFCDDDILLGHNIKRFDMPMIRAEAARAGLPEPDNTIIDTLPIAQTLFPGQRNRVVDLIQRLDIAQVETHRATDDAMQTAEIYERLKLM